MVSPWAASAAHVFDADDPAQLRSSLASIPPARYAVAIWRPDQAQPHVAQASRTQFPNCATTDGFGHARTGLHGPEYVQELWGMLQAAAQFVETAEGFLDRDVRELARPALYGGPRLAGDDK